MELNQSLDNALANIKTQFQESLQQILKDNQDQWESNLQQSQQSLLQQIDPECVKLNVGGMKFITTKEVLTSMKNSKLDKMMNGRYPIVLDDKKRIFIDRNGQYFGYVLDCLRNGKVMLPESGQLRKRIEAEVKYFELVDNPSPAMQSGTLTKAAGVNFQGNYAWKFATSETIMISDNKIQADGTIEFCGHAVGDREIKSGYHEWRFKLEAISDKVESFGVIGIASASTWGSIKTGNDDYIRCYAWSTAGEAFIGPEGDGDTDFHDEIPFGSEVRVIYKIGEMKLQMEYNKNGMKKSYNMTGVNGGTYYPYFYLSNARVKLLETTGSF